MRSISPLRYPGGKSRLYKKVENIILKTNLRKYAEPFSGGFGVGLLLLENNVVDQVYINDLDRNIFSLWKCIKNNHHYLIKEIKRVSKFLNFYDWLKERDLQIKILNSNRYGFKKKAFATLFLNRVNRSGILSAGPIGGKSQDGKYKINCRFNPNRLINLINNISKNKNKILVYNDDFQVFLKNIKNDVFVFLDPPYVVKGGDLYMNNFSLNDHIKLRNFLINFDNFWIMTYDHSELIINIYQKKFKIQNFELNHYAGKFKIGKELFISK